MSFEEEREHDPYGGMPFSKGYFLKTCVECGAALTGYLEAVEMPYYGAHFHAEELEGEGMLRREPFEGMPTCTIWIPTTAGKIVGMAP